MSLIIPDETLREAGLDERDALVEFACRLFEAGRLTLWSAAKLARLNRVEFEHELLSRKIPLYQPDPSDLADDLASFERLGA
jgi:predicted HTH domain antitoxin